MILWMEWVLWFLGLSQLQDDSLPTMAVFFSVCFYIMLPEKRYVYCTETVQRSWATGSCCFLGCGIKLMGHSGSQLSQKKKYRFPFQLPKHVFFGVILVALSEELDEFPWVFGTSLLGRISGCGSAYWWGAADSWMTSCWVDSQFIRDSMFRIIGDLKMLAMSVINFCWFSWFWQSLWSQEKCSFELCCDLDLRLPRQLLLSEAVDRLKEAPVGGRWNLDLQLCERKMGQVLQVWHLSFLHVCAIWLISKWFFQLTVTFWSEHLVNAEMTPREGNFLSNNFSINEDRLEDPL